MTIGRTAEIWIIAGPNGAGKTTYVTREPILSLLRHVRTLNADDRTKELLARQGLDFSASAEILAKTFIEAANLTFAETLALLERGEAVCVETVLSTHKYKELVEAMISSGNFFGLIYIGLSSPELACERVSKRRRQGGHGVPADKVRARWERSIDHLGWYARHAHVFLAFDNSNAITAGESPTPFATGYSGCITIHDRDAIPAITRRLSGTAP